ncbi:MAG: two-component system aerobic respiration control sensor histidine kinase ArcB, partial [Paraglaciecola sp.]
MQFQDSVEPWALRFAQFINHFGTLKVSVLFVFLTLAFTLTGTYFLRFYIIGDVKVEDFMSAIILTIISAPWVLFFFSELVKQLERSRGNLADVVTQLESLRAEDVLLSRELQNNIKQLNYEIEQRKNAQAERENVFSELESQIREKSDQEIQAQRLSTLLRSIIDASPDLIYYRNEEGRFAGCNRVAEQMTGKKEEELIGLTPYEVYDEELARQVVASDHEVLEKNASITEELWLRFADGGRGYFEMRKVPFYAKDGTRLGLLAFGRDITERKQAENMVAKTSRDKTAFIATISHELRTP